METAISIDRLVQVHQAIKDARTIKRQAWEQADAALETDQNKIRAVMLAQLNAMGGKSVATEHGTVYRMEKIKPSVADWRALYDWIMVDPERFEALEKRVKATFIKQFMDENSGALPPGVNVLREFEVAVRRPTTSPSNGATDQ